VGSVAVVWLSLTIASGLAAETQFVGWCLSLAFTHCRELLEVYSGIFFYRYELLLPATKDLSMSDIIPSSCVWVLDLLNQQ